MAPRRITTRNARFQQWQALLANRSKRHRGREFLVHGVRPVTLAVEQGWTVRALVYDADRRLSRWARELLASTSAECWAMAPELLAELGEREDGTELLAVVEMPPDDFSRIPVGPEFLGVAFDRPTSPGNVGSVIRSADSFGAHGVVVTGHAADVYDPKSVRASTGSLFGLPTVRAPGHREVAEWLGRARAAGTAVTVIGTDEDGDTDVFSCDLTRPVLLAVGNETAGLSPAWRELCDETVSIPMTGSASSLNAANAASVVLYEAARQRIAARGAAAPSGAPGGAAAG